MKLFFLLFKKEWLHIWHDVGIRTILLVIPFLSLVLFAFLYNDGVILHIPTAIVDLDHSENSRMVSEQFQASENLEIIAFYDTFAALENAIRDGDIKTGIVIPKDFGKNIELRRSTRLLMVIDGTNMIYATNAGTSMMEVAETLKATVGVKTLLAYRPATDDDSYSSVGNLTDGADVTLSDVTGKSSTTSSTGDFELDMNLYDAGYTMAEAMQVYMPITFEDEGWFNPTLNYGYFVLLGLFLNIWQQCCMLLFCMNIISETGSASWVQIKISGYSRFKLFCCKSLLQIAVALGVAALILLISFRILQLPTSISFAAWMGFLLCFVLAGHALGTMMSALTKNSVDATRLSMVIALPSFILSGFSWPLEEMGATLQKLAWCIPQTWLFQGVNYFSFKNPPISFLQHYCFMLLGMAALMYLVSCITIMCKERV